MQLNDRIIFNIKKNFNLDIKFDFNDDTPKKLKICTTKV